MSLHVFFDVSMVSLIRVELTAKGALFFLSCELRQLTNCYGLSVYVPALVATSIVAVLHTLCICP